MRKGSLLFRWAKWYVLLIGVLLVVLIGLTSDIYAGDDPAILRRNVEWLGVGMIFLACVLAGLLWIPLAKRMERIGETVKRYAEGDYLSRLPADDGTEVGELENDLNWMAHQLHVRGIVEEERRRQQEAVLASMIEGMMAIDVDGCFISMNGSARRMLNVEKGDVEGRHVYEVVRQDDFKRFIREALSAEEPVTAHLLLQGGTPRHLELSSNTLIASDGHRLGALIMMNDVTQIRRLESMRRDFVANVSHELRTPITSIKGFMETLLDGAMEEPDEARRFLQIIAKQADRLDAIIEDLLSLSRVEQESERGEIALKSGRLADVLSAAVQTVQTKAETRGVRIEVMCPDALTAHMNAPLLEQAIVNLVDNAIKYSDEGKSVLVKAVAEEGAVRIEVVDQGHGIAREHHDRIFQRFYRVDKSRSRQLGGTGLGLAIVKHITQAHGGTVSVESVVGKGSTFTIRLPAQP